MKKIVFFLFVFIACMQAIAQQNGNLHISGNVIDSIAATTITSASVTLFEQGNKKQLAGAATDLSGHFNLPILRPGIYVLVVAHSSYQPQTIAAISIKNNSVTFKNIALAKKQTLLQDVVIVAPRGLIENKIDKLIFNVEKDLTSQTGVATDVLKKVPQVSVDVDGNVQLAGNSGIRFLINGKPSSAFGSNIADVLQSIPASQIKSIEVITNPGAKYDAQGLGGIINIILKESRVKGMNGNLSLTGGTRQQNGSLNINVRKGNFGFNALASGGYRLNSTLKTTTNRTSTDTVAKIFSQLNQQGQERFTRHGYQTGMGFDWSLDKKNSLSGSVGYNIFEKSGYGSMDQLLVNKNAGNGNILQNILSVTQNNNRFYYHGIDASINYKRTFDKEGKELSLSANSSWGNNKSNLANSQMLVPQDSLFYGSNSNNPAKERETEIKLDFTQPIKKDIVLGVGGKLTLNSIDNYSNIFSLQPSSKAYLFNNSLSNYLNYQQKVYALYSEVSFPVAHFFDAKLGLRYERTAINAYYSNAQQQVAAPGYNTFVPSVYFSKKIDETQTVKLSYSKRIERPEYWDLNPFVNTNDPKNLDAGNPYLVPEIGHRFELGYNRTIDKIGSFMINAFYRINNHDIQPYVVYYPSLKVGDSAFTNVSVSTKQNIGSEKNAGVNLFADIHVTKKLNIRSNLFFFQRHTINALNPGYNSNSFNYRANLNAGYQFTNTLAAEFFGNFNSARNEVQGRYPSFTSYSLALRKQFWNKKGSLALTANNFFNNYVNQVTSLYGTNFQVYNLRQVPYRSVGINFTWKFGKLEFKKEKEEQSENLNGPKE